MRSQPKAAADCWCRYGVIEKPELVLGNVEFVSDIRAAQERKSPVVNARKARCQNFESNFMSGDK